MELQEAVIIHDEEIKSKKGRFDNFFNTVETMMNENDLTVAEERRNSDICWMGPAFISLADLYRNSETKMKEMYPDDEKNYVPSYQYFRLQFMPRKIYSNVAKK